MEFRAYAPDCVAAASFEPGDGRLNDTINKQASIVVRHAVLTSLGDGHAIEKALLALTREDLCAVVAAGSRGVVARRIRTRQQPVAVEVGPYLVHGFLHAPPSASALGGLSRRPTMVAITDATITYTRAGQEVTEKIETLLVNRLLARTFTSWLPTGPGPDVPPVYSMRLSLAFAN